MPSNPARSATDKRLKKNREAAGKVRKTDPKGPKVTTTARINPRMAALLDGTLKIEDLDNEEIERGRCRGPNGKFGKQSALVPAKFHQLMVNELKKRMEKRFAEDVEPARKILRELMNNPRVSADARYKSAVFLIERGIGKTPEKSEVQVSVSPWEDLLGDEDVVVDYGGEASTDGAKRSGKKSSPFE